MHAVECTSKVSNLLQLGSCACLLRRRELSGSRMQFITDEPSAKLGVDLGAQNNFANDAHFDRKKRNVSQAWLNI